MKLYEFASGQDEASKGYDPAQDKIGVRQLSDVRKPKLTLRHLNRLKKIRAMKRLDALKREDLLGIMYGMPEEPAGPPGF